MASPAKPIGDDMHPIQLAVLGIAIALLVMAAFIAMSRPEPTEQQKYAAAIARRDAVTRSFARHSEQVHGSLWANEYHCDSCWTFGQMIDAAWAEIDALTAPRFDEAPATSAVLPVATSPWVRNAGEKRLPVKDLTNDW